jgi:hypothetical protein
MAQQHMPPVDISLDMESIKGINQPHIQYKSVKTDQVRAANRSLVSE